MEYNWIFDAYNVVLFLIDYNASETIMRGFLWPFSFPIVISFKKELIKLIASYSKNSIHLIWYWNLIFPFFRNGSKNTFVIDDRIVFFCSKYWFFNSYNNSNQFGSIYDNHHETKISLACLGNVCQHFCVALLLDCW